MLFKTGVDRSIGKRHKRFPTILERVKKWFYRCFIKRWKTLHLAKIFSQKLFPNLPLKYYFKINYVMYENLSGRKLLSMY